MPARAWDPHANRDLVRALAARGETVRRDRRAPASARCARTWPAAWRTTWPARPTSPRLARVIADADALVVGNTGAAHVAAAVGTPTVSLFPPTIPAVRFRPWMVQHVLLGDQDIACRGCRARECPLEDQPCLGVVTVGDVLAALDGLRAAQSAAASAGAPR